MDLDLTPDQELVLDTAVRFIESKWPLSAVRAFVDGMRALSTDFRTQSADLGWFAMLVPESLGGGAVSDNPRARRRRRRPRPRRSAAARRLRADERRRPRPAREGSDEQQAKVLPGLMNGTQSASWAAAGPTGEWEPGAGAGVEARGGAIVLASAEFLSRHIPKMLSGEELWVQFFSEPEAGSDLAGIRTRATRGGDGWILNGSNIWSSGAHYADYGMCLARTVGRAEAPRAHLVRGADHGAGRHRPADQGDQR